MSKNEIANEVEVRTPEIIAGEIKASIFSARRMMVDTVVFIGNSLIEAKEMVDHGEWEAYIEDNFDFSQSTVNKYMKIAKNFTDLKAGITAEIGYKNALQIVSLPDDQQDDILNSLETGDLQVNELEKTISDLKKKNTELEKENQKLKDELSSDELKEKIVEYEKAEKEFRKKYYELIGLNEVISSYDEIEGGIKRDERVTLLEGWIEDPN